MNEDWYYMRSFGEVLRGALSLRTACPLGGCSDCRSYLLESIERFSESVIQYMEEHKPQGKVLDMCKENVRLCAIAHANVLREYEENRTGT